MSRVVYISPISSRSGYGDCSRDFASYLLHKYKNEVSFLSTRWGNCQLSELDTKCPIVEKIRSQTINTLDSSPDICYQTLLPHEIQSIGNINICITAGYEYTAWPEESLIKCDGINKTIVHSEFTRRCMLDKDHNTYELKTNPYVVHQSAPSVFYDKTFKRDNNIDTTLDTIVEDFCFLNVGVFNQTSDRKNIRQTIQSFQQAFKGTHSSGKVALVLKINGPKYNTTDFIGIKQYISEINKEFKNPSSVYLLYGNYTPTQLKSLYTHPKIKCYISLSHGEGFGRPVLESTLSELPVILTNWSGHTEFIPSKSDLLISGTLTKVNDTFPNKTSKSMWFSPDINSATACIDRVYENYDEYKSLAINLSTNNLRKYNKDTMFEKYTQILKDY